MVSEVIVKALKAQGESKQWLAQKLSLSYSTLHQKLSNNTFTAEELILLCDIFNLSIEHFRERNTGELIDLKSFPIESRPDVLIEEMDQYYNGGIHIESEHVNGCLVYIPFGLMRYLKSQERYMDLIVESYEEGLNVALERNKSQEEKVMLENMEFQLKQLNRFLVAMKHEWKEFE